MRGMKKFITDFCCTSIGCFIGFSISTLAWLYFIVPICNQAQKPVIISQKEEVQIIEVYQVTGGIFETCLSHKDGTRSLWTNHKLGEVGEKIFIWRNGSHEWTQNPNN